jgi:hypothetical protein
MWACQKKEPFETSLCLSHGEGAFDPGILSHVNYFPKNSSNRVLKLLSVPCRYLKAPIDYRANLEQSLLLDRILNEAYALHLWNAQTVRLVPETGSLVEIILNRNCMRCTDLL